jgi:hypothetical protein
MAKTIKRELIGFVTRRVSPLLSDPRQVVRPDNVESWIDAACMDLADDLFHDEGNSLRTKLQKTYTITLASGVASLATHTDLIADSLKGARIMHSSSTLPLEYIPDLRSLPYVHDSGLLYYALANDAIHTRDSAGSLTGLTGTLTVDGAFFVPFIHLETAGSTTLPEHSGLRSLLIRKILGIAAEALSIPPERLAIGADPAK